MKTEFFDLTLPEFKTCDAKRIIIPAAQVEAHGPHLPIGTDGYIAHEIAQRAAERAQCLVGPPLLYGTCKDFACWPGYIVIRPATLTYLMEDISSSFDHQGFERIVFFLIHGGNFYNSLVLSSLYVESPEIIVTSLPQLLGNDLKSEVSGIHIETVLMLAIRPDLVQKDKYPGSVAPPPEKLRKFHSNKVDLSQYSKEGIITSPENASEELGEEILDSVSLQLAMIITE